MREKLQIVNKKGYDNEDGRLSAETIKAQKQEIPYAVVPYATNVAYSGKGLQKRTRDNSRASKTRNNGR